MPIDMKTETLRSLTEAAKLIPGKPRCLATMHRWRLRGIKGRKLECVVVGNIHYTSDEALKRFFAALNGSDETTEGATPSQRIRRSRSARKELEKLGV